MRLFEAPGGGSSWMPSGTAGEFHMKPLGNAELHFQLRDLLVASSFLFYNRNFKISFS